MRLLLVFILLAAACGPTDREAALRTYLQRELEKPPEDYPAVRYLHGFVDLNGDGREEAIVYVIGPGYYCGSGGCNMLVLTPEGGTFRTVSKSTITNLPIRVLPARSNGWRSIAVTVRGGGIQPGYEAELRYDGKEYPSNPSVPPAGKLPGTPPGETLIPQAAYDDAAPLWP